MAAIVTDVEGHVLYERASDRHVMPASNMKLLSNSFALYELGPRWRPETRVWKEPSRTVVETTGDPMLTHDQLVELRTHLALDPSLPVYVREPYAPLWRDNWEVGDLPNKFAAPVTAFTVDRGSFEIWAEGGRPEFRPEAYGTKVVDTKLPNDEKTDYDPFGRRLLAAPGAFAKNGLVDTLSLPHPDQAAADVLGHGMRPTEEVPARAPDFVLAGPPLADIEKACLPPSDNQLAEQLLMLGSLHEGPLGDDPYLTARRRETEFLTRVVGVAPSDLRVDDGSGLSRHNFVTVRALAKLLAWDFHQPTGQMFEDALAQTPRGSMPGTGTLAHRLSGVPFSGKTGSLDMVVALSGYLTVPGQPTRIVSIVLNEFSCSDAEARNVEDRFVRAPQLVDACALHTQASIKNYQA